MQMISSEAGTRLAKAKVALDRAEEAMECAAELVASGYHDLDGGEA